MVDPQNIAIIIFFALLLLFIYWKRKEIYLQKILWPFLYFVMYKGKWGINLMRVIAKKFPQTVRVFGFASILVGFLGMVLIAGTLIFSLVHLFMAPEAVAGVALVLPVKIKGTFYVPFLYWIISIFVLAVVHEFSHGMVAKAYGLKIKSSGLAFLGIIIPILPAAFVEPDEKMLKKASARQQLSVFAAGPFANILLAAIIIGLFFLVLTPLATAILQPNGIRITGFIQDDSPAEQAGIMQDDIIMRINGVNISTLNNFTLMLNGTKPGDTLQFTTQNESFDVVLGEHPQDENRSYMGIYVQQHMQIRETFSEKYGRVSAVVIVWLIGLFYWLYVLNLGIGLFNLLPLGPLDGGRMFLTALQSKLEAKKALHIWKVISTFFLFIIIINIVFAFIK